MLPLHDSPRTRQTPWITWTLIALNVAVFLYELSLGPKLEALVYRAGVVPARIIAALDGDPRVSPWVLATLITAMFLHAGWLHIGGNMLFLWIFGDNVEDRLGHASYLLFYFICGIVANLAEVFFLPSSTLPGIGASGAIAGVLGAYALTYPGARVSVLIPVFFIPLFVDVPALIMIGFWFASQFFSGVASLAVATAAQSGGVAWWAHVGGFLCGMLLMAILPKQAPPAVPHWSSNLAERARADTGLVGLVTGTVGLVSQLVQIVILIRMVLIFLGIGVLRFLPAPLGGVVEIIRWTAPLVRPFALVIPIVRFGGHIFELDALVAVLAYYFLGVAVIWAIAGLAYGGQRSSDRPSRL